MTHIILQVANTLDIKSILYIVGFMITIFSLFFGFGKGYSNIISLINRNQASLENLTNLIQKDIDFLKSENILRINEIKRKTDVEYFKEKIDYLTNEIEKIKEKLDELKR